MPNPPLVSVTEASKLLRVSPRTVNRMLERGILTSVKVGRLRRIHRAAVDAIVEDGIRKIA